MEAAKVVRANGQNIGLARELIALFDTANFVDREMNGIASSPDPRALMKLSLEKVAVPGLYMEFGVYSGATINYISGRTSETVFGFDSFEGLPEFWRDRFDLGAFALPGLPKVNTNVKLIKGWFSDTLPSFLQEHPEKFSFVHVDCDLYSSTVCIFTLAEDRFQEGTVIIFDEYFNYPGWKYGEHLAFTEFLSRTKFSFEYLGYCRNHEQVAVRLKTKA